MDRYDVELSDLIDQDEIPFFDHATTISVSGPSDYEISYQEDSDRATPRMTGIIPTTPSSIRRWWRTISPPWPTWTSQTT